MKKNIEIVLKQLESAKREISAGLVHARREKEHDRRVWEAMVDIGLEIERLQRRLRAKAKPKKVRK